MPPSQRPAGARPKPLLRQRFQWQSILELTVLLLHQQSHLRLKRKLLLLEVAHEGRLSPAMFKQSLREGRLPRLLSLIGLQKQHARDFFALLSSQSADGTVEVESFVTGCMKLKGSATSFDLHMLKVDVRSVRDQLKQLRRA